MKKSILILILSFISIFGQSKYSYEAYRYQFVSILPRNNNLLLLVHHSLPGDSIQDNCWNYYVAIISNKDGSLLKKISLPGKIQWIYDFAVSNDGKSFVLTTKEITSERPYLIKKYSLDENRWEWEKEWNGTNINLLHNYELSFRLKYSEDDKQIIGASTKNTIVLNSETGALIKTSNNISSIQGEDNTFLKFDVSKNGRYAAFWWSKYLTFSSGDETILLTLLDYSWYSLKRLFYLGSIPNYMYVWDIYKDTLFCKIQIPYEAITGVPVFTPEEKEVVFGPFEGKYQIYSLEKRKLEREFIQNESKNSIERNYGTFPDYKSISSDNKYLTAPFYSGNDIFLIDYQTCNLINRIKQSSINFPLDSWATTFSSDSKYYSTISQKDTLNLYETTTWKKLRAVSLKEYFKIEQK